MTLKVKIKSNPRPFFFALVIFTLDLFFWYSDTTDDQYPKRASDLTKWVNYGIENTISKVEWFFLGLDDKSHPIGWIIYKSSYLFNFINEYLGIYPAGLFSICFFIFIHILIFMLWYQIGRIFFWFWDFCCSKIDQTAQ